MPSRATDGSTTHKDERFFGFSEDELWGRVPSDWIRAGTLFPDQDNRFWRLVKPEPGGWWCEPVPESEVGNAQRLALVRKTKLDLELVESEAAELAEQVKDEQGRSATRDRLEELEQTRRKLREELVRLCNSRIAQAKEPGEDPDRPKNWLLAGIAVAFILALATGISLTLGMSAEPRRTSTTLLVISFALLGLALFLVLTLPRLFGPGSRKGARLLDRIPISGNLVGCTALAVIALVAGIFGYLLLVVMKHFQGGLSNY